MSDLDELSPDMTPIPVSKFEEFLKIKRRRCSGCGSGNLEGFIDEIGGEREKQQAMFSTLPDQDLVRYVPTLPAVCTDCGLIALYWTAVIRRWMLDNA